jgi:hypothetical protein
MEEPIAKRQHVIVDDPPSVASAPPPPPPCLAQLHLPHVPAHVAWLPITVPPEWLIEAAKVGNAAAVAAALRNPRTDPNRARSCCGNTGLLLAAMHGRTAALKVLLADDRVDVNRRNKDGNTALVCATCEGHDVAVGELLADDRVDPNITNRDGGTALVAAVYFERTTCLRKILADKRVEPNQADKHGFTALSVAAEYSHGAVLEELLDDHRTIRMRPPDHRPQAQAAYDEALRNVKRRRNARFRGLTRLMVVFRRMRLRAAQTVYAPGGAGFAAAAASFNAAANLTNQMG